MSGERLAGMSHEELAGQIWLRGRTPRTGHVYARRGDLAGKETARGRVMSILAGPEWGRNLSVLTMPGLHWRLEGDLLAQRRQQGQYTCLVGIERDEAIFRASVRKMPGARKLTVLEPGEYATASIRSASVYAYHRCTFEDYARLSKRGFHAAWLDFNGPVRTERLEAIAAFWPRVGVLIVTAMSGRSPLGPGDVRDALDGAALVDTLRYNDTCPMWQAVYARPGSKVAKMVAARLKAKDEKTAARAAASQTTGTE